MDHERIQTTDAKAKELRGHCRPHDHPWQARVICMLGVRRKSVIQGQGGDVESSLGNWRTATESGPGGYTRV